MIAGRDPAPAPAGVLGDPFATAAVALLGLGGVLLAVGALGPWPVVAIGAVAAAAAVGSGAVYVGTLARADAGGGDRSRAAWFLAAAGLVAAVVGCTLTPIAVGFWDDLAAPGALAAIGCAAAVVALPLSLVGLTRARRAGDAPSHRLAAFALAAGVVAVGLLGLLALLGIAIAAGAS